MNEYKDMTVQDGMIPVSEPERQYYFMEQAKAWTAAQKKRLGRELTACVVTFGCQMNARDSEKLVGILETIGYTMTEDEQADFIIYNTCTVRENANLKVYGRLGHLKKLKEKNPHMIIALCGCMMQEPLVVEKIKTSFKHVDIIFGTHNIYKFAELICMRNMSAADEESRPGKHKKHMIIDIWKDTDKIVEGPSGGAQV